MIGFPKLDQLQRMPIRIAELECNDASRQQFWAIPRNRCETHLLKLLVSCCDIVCRQGAVLEPDIIAVTIGRIGCAGRVAGR